MSRRLAGSAVTEDGVQRQGVHSLLQPHGQARMG